MIYTQKEIAELWGKSVRTLRTRLRELEQKKEFIKSQPGYMFTEAEKEKLLKLLGVE